MASISTAFKGKGPYSQALKVKVVAVESKTRQYKGSDGSDKASLTSAVSDGDNVIKLVCYHTTKFQKFKVRISLNSKFPLLPQL